MSESEHTPGPWHWVGEGIQHVAGPDNMPICDCGSKNGFLIAAAPELKKACEEVLKQVRIMPIELVREIEAALAKAEGKP